MKKVKLLKDLDDLAQHSARMVCDPQLPFFGQVVELRKKNIENSLILSLIVKVNGRICKEYLSRLISKEGTKIAGSNDLFWVFPSQVEEVTLIKSKYGFLDIETPTEYNRLLTDEKAIMLVTTLDEMECIDDAVLNEVVLNEQISFVLHNLDIADYLRL